MVDGFGFTVWLSIVGLPLGPTVTVTTPPGAEVTAVLGALVAVDVVVDSAEPSAGVPVGAIVVVTPFGSVLVTVTSGLPGLPGAEVSSTAAGPALSSETFRTLVCPSATSEPSRCDIR